MSEERLKNIRRWQATQAGAKIQEAVTTIMEWEDLAAELRDRCLEPKLAKDAQNDVKLSRECVVALLEIRNSLIERAVS